MADLKSLLKRADGQYASRKQAAENRVARWEYWSGQAYDLRPYYFERFNTKRGKPLAKRTGRAYAYGFDRDGRIVIVSQPKSRDEPAYEEIFEHSPGAITSAAYTDDGAKVFYASRYELKGGRLSSSGVLDANQSDEFTEKYGYEDGRLTEIKVLVRDGAKRTKHRFTLKYNRDGKLRTIARDYGPADVPLPVWFNPDLNLSVESVGRQIRARLVERIPQVVARARIDEPAYCVAIAYDVVDETMPMIGVGLERERERWIKSKGKSAREVVWNPKKFSRFRDGTLDLPGDEDLGELCATLDELVSRRGEYHHSRNLFVSIAAELNKHNWSKSLPVTNDFVVVAVDVGIEGYKLKENLKAAIPAPRLQMLRRKKLA